MAIPPSLGGGNAFEHWLEPVFERAHAALAHAPHAVEPTEYLLMALSIAVALSGIWGARMLYLRRPELPEQLRQRFSGAYRILFNKYYVDEAYDAAVVNPLVKGSERLLWKGIDVGLIDRLVNGTAALFASLSRVIRLVQNGVVETYLLVFVLGVVATLAWLLAG
jgi:NADH-quinone oxidoreductase subunit L